jgi:hypothetical protein
MVTENDVSILRCAEISFVRRKREFCFWEIDPGIGVEAGKREI